MPFQKKDETRQKILKNALHVFCQKGLAATTVIDIAKQAGVNKALVYYYFGDKSGLIQVLFEDQFQKIVDAFREGEAVSSWDELILSIFEIKQSYSHFIRLIISEMLLNRTSIVIVALKQVLQKNQINIQSTLNRFLLTNEKFQHSSLYSREMIGLLIGILLSDILSKNLMFGLFNLAENDFKQYQKNLIELTSKLILIED